MTEALITAAASVQEAAPAGGAAIWEAALGTAVGVLLTVALVLLGWAHRTGRITFLAKLGERASEHTGLPPWAAVPSVIVAGSLIVALVGMYWDISLHIADGRDSGPFANPAHFLILFGLFGVFIAGFCAVVLPEGKPSRSAVRISGDWYAPLGGIGLLAASSFALIGFPLDDFWHRLFGQDVTLWGPTHLMMIGGAALAFIGQVTLLGEAKMSEREPLTPDARRAAIAAVLQKLRMPALFGGFLIGLSTFQAEFDFGVPQFRMMFEPVMIAFAASIALVAARIYGGRGMALAAVAFFVVIRGGLTLLVGPILGEPTPHFPLYLAEALLVEGAALMIAPRKRPIAFGAFAGVLIATVGFAAEYAWSHAWMPIAWQPSLVGEALLPTMIVGIAGGVIGGFLGNAWVAPTVEGGTRKIPLGGVVASLLAIVAVVGYGLQVDVKPGVTADVALTEVGTPDARMVDATVRIDPPEAAENANWVNATAWQGYGFQVDQLVPTEREGEYRTAEPLPVHGNWKALIRIQKGSSIAGIPVFLPEDPAIPATEVPASATFTREFVRDIEILQREQLDGVPTWTKLAGYTVVGSIVALIIILLGWIVTRLGDSYRGPGGGVRRDEGAGERKGGVTADPAGGTA